MAPIFLGSAFLALPQNRSATLGSAQRAITAPCDITVNPAEKQELIKALNGDIFPLLPKEITDYDPEDNVKTECVPGLWNRTIIGMLLFKILGLLNYVAGALAVVATIYAGVLYLTGAIAEGTVKKAKSILIGTYVGFFIVLSARLIVQGSFYLFSDEPAEVNNNLEKILPQNPSP